MFGCRGHIAFRSINKQQVACLCYTDSHTCGVFEILFENRVVHV